MTYILITGASRGIGEQLAYECARHSHDIILTARSKQDLAKVAKNAQKLGANNVQTVVIDLVKDNAVEQLCKQIQNLPVSKLINNAGFGDYGAFVDADIEKLSKMIHLNCTALTQLTYHVAQRMKNKKQGKILNVASTAAFQPGPFMATYFASKAYVLSFSEAIREELKPFNITVTTLCPGPVPSGFQKAAGLKTTRKMTSRDMSAKEVAIIGYKAMIEGKSIVIPGNKNAIMAWSTRFLPSKILTKIVANMNKKERSNQS